MIALTFDTQVQMIREASILHSLYDKVWPALICALMVIPVATVTLPYGSASADSSEMADKILGGNPSITAPSPIGTTVIGQGYGHNATCTSPDVGVVNWTLSTSAPWLIVVGGGDGQLFCNLSGTPSSAGEFWANLTVNDTDSYNYVNWTIEVKEPGRWGFVETLYDLATGTRDPSTISLQSGNLSLLNVDGDEESVVLDGKLYVFSRTTHANITVARYSPIPMNDGIGWNLSAEVCPTREDSSYRGASKPVPKLGMLVYLANESSTLAGVSFYVAGASDGGESIKIFNAKTSSWSSVASNILPTTPNRYDDHPEEPQLSQSIYGTTPDRYVVAFRYASGASTCEITVIHTSVGLLAKAVVDLPDVIGGSPKLVFVSDVVVSPPPPGESFSHLGCWMVDNLGFRGLSSRYIVADPFYEYVTKGYPLWVSVKDIDGRVIDDAAVTIAGASSFFIPSRQRNEVVVELSVGWSQRLSYHVSADGVELSDAVLATIMTDLSGQKVSMPLWWNGWDWVTVFGRDDSFYPNASVDTYSAYNHPGTSYMQGNSIGTSADLLYTQSEMGIHYPHDNLVWPKKLWSEAVASADSGHNLVESKYTFASRWDDPSYVGVGDMFITVACPGNSGSIQQMYAQYARGTRIMGISSNYNNGAPGNHSLMGAWWPQSYPAVYADWNAPISQWYPYTPYDMMDAARGPCPENPLAPGEWEWTYWVAEHGGVRRIYSHGGTAPGASYLSWIDNPKTNFSYENWKATDGEVASYVYGRWSTDVVYDQFASNGTITAYDVQRRDPILAGYWRVPVTIAFNVSGRMLADINITEGSKTYLKSDGTLHNLNAKRIMDVGYDIRGETVYVSYFWNSSSELSFIFSDDVPLTNTPPVASFVVDSNYGSSTKVFVFDATSSSDAQDPLSELMFRWSWDGDNVYETDWSSNPIAHHQFLVIGNHTVRLQVMDRGSLTGESVSYVEVSDLAIPEFDGVILLVAGIVPIFIAVSVGLRRKKQDQRD